MESSNCLPGTSQVMLQAPYSTPRLKFSLEKSLTLDEEGDTVLAGIVIRIMYF